ncbi:MAG: helix-turn-helix domain-containing protein [Atribacterota bacterium]
MGNFNREIAKEVGKLLQRTREEKGISLEKVEAATFISERFLKAFEEGTWENLPGKTYVLGYAKVYARFLGLDEREISALCQRAYGTVERHFVKEEGPKKPQSKKRKKVLLGVLVSLAVLCSVVLGIFLAFPFLQEGENEKSTTTALVEPSPSLLSETPTPSFAVTLQLKAEKVAWIEVASMGNVLFSGILVPGKIYVFRSEGPIEISGERGNTIQVWLNGEEKGYLTQDPGPFQEVFTP